MSIYQSIVGNKYNLSILGVGLEAHDDRCKTGALRPAARPLHVQKKHFRNYQKPLNFDFLNKYSFLHVDLNNNCFVK